MDRTQYRDWVRHCQDCFAYALARDVGEPLLFKGGDFARTDIELVTEPVRERRLSERVARYVAAGTG